MALSSKKQSEGGFMLSLRIGIGILAVLFTAVIISRLVYPFDAGFLEAFNWMAAQHLLEGKNPYAYAFAPPYSMSPYGIVYYILQAIGVKLFGFQLWWARILSVLSFAVCIWAITGITKRLTGSIEASRVSGLACLAMFSAQFWIAHGRFSDFAAAALALVALRIVFAFEEEKQALPATTVFGAVLLLTAAFFAKQTLLLPPLIVFLRLLQLNKWRAAARLASLFFISVAAIIFLLNYTSSGGYLWQHFTHAQGLPHSWTASLRYFGLMLGGPAYFFFIVFLCVFLSRRRKFFDAARREKLLSVARSPKTLILLYFVLSLAWSFASAGRHGANVNYYLENSLVAAIVCGIIYADFRLSGSTRPALALIVLLTLGGAFQMTRVLRGEYFRWQALGYYREVFETVGRAAPTAAAGGKCISIFPELVVWNGCTFNFTDWEEYDNGWSPELRRIFETELNAGRYDAILWYDDKLQTRFPNYRLVPMKRPPPEKFYPVYLYVRETPAAAAPPSRSTSSGPQ